MSARLRLRSRLSKQRLLRHGRQERLYPRSSSAVLRPSCRRAFPPLLFLRDYLDAMALASGFVASLAGIASEFNILATWLVVLVYFLALGLSLFPSVLPAPGLLTELVRRLHGHCGEQDWNIWKL